MSDSLEDYASLLRDDMGFYYKGAWKELAKTYLDAAEFLEGRYATGAHYAEKIVGLIETYGLDRYDEALDWEPVDEDDGDIHHVAMYLGDGFYLHAPETGDVVKVASMEEYEPDFALSKAAVGTAAVFAVRRPARRGAGRSWGERACRPGGHGQCTVMSRSGTGGG